MFYKEVFHFAALCLISLIWFSYTNAVEVGKDSSPVWTYNCIEKQCRKSLIKKSDYKPHDNKEVLESDVTSLNVCKLFCSDPPGSLWPLPTGIIDIKGPALPMNKKNVEINIKSTGDLNDYDSKALDILKWLSDDFKEKILKKSTTEKDSKDAYTLEISAFIKNPNKLSLNFETDESYTLKLFQESSKLLKAHLLSESYFGLRHGLETLNQLIVYDDIQKQLVVPQSINITDKPAYPYRALTLDTSRNFISVKSIKRTLDGMALNKLNVFHWHITDTHSFPFETPSLPLFTKYGAYSSEKIYKPSDINEIVEYAKRRGINVIPEFDAPAHVGEGWQWTPPGTVVCLNEQPWIDYCVEPPCGQLNPTKDNVFEILTKLYSDIVKIFDLKDIFHMGGDEVHFKCWNKTSQITDWMKERGWETDNDGFLELWNYFQENALKSFEKSVADKNKKPDIILWTSGFTTGKLLEKFLDKTRYIIQIWTTSSDNNIAELIRKGYRVIFSNYDALYFDCGFGGWVSSGNNWCSPYIPWQKVYMNDPVKIVKELLGTNYTQEMEKQILGQAATLWTEQADDQTIDNRFWPRASALAERTWSDPEINWNEAEYRILHQRERLAKIGIASEALEPEWCNQNEGYCPLVQTKSKTEKEITSVDEHKL